VSKLTRLLAWPLFSQAAFEFYQRLGVHVLRKHYYSPIPDTARLLAQPDLWSTPSELAGIDMNDAGQLTLLREVVPRYVDECRFPVHPTGTSSDYYVSNQEFGLISATVLHSIVREFKPARVIEVGSGSSTLVAARALRMTGRHDVTLTAIEPFPNRVLLQGVEGLTRLVAERVENLDVATFSELEENDILFIDSTHVFQMAGDVDYLYFKVLPALKPGVIVHIHDIFLPKPYPQRFVVEQRHFWNEQYLLQAFLMFNDEFRVLWCSSYMQWKYPDLVESTIPPLPGLGKTANYYSGSFWMQRRK
jgi:hypothetical protein